MVIEDDDELRQLYEVYLTDTFEVTTASSGEEALERLSDEIEVILLDRRLPGMDGDEILDRVRRMGTFRVAMVTAVSPDFDIVEMPFDDYITKPVSRGELTATVEHLLDLRTYDEKMDEYLRLARKRALLIEERPAAATPGNPEFDELEDRLHALREEVDALRDTVVMRNESALLNQPQLEASD